MITKSISSTTNPRYEADLNQNHRKPMTQEETLLLPQGEVVPAATSGLWCTAALTEGFQKSSSLWVGTRGLRGRGAGGET